MDIILNNVKPHFDPLRHNWFYQSKTTSQFKTCMIGLLRCFVKRKEHISASSELQKQIQNESEFRLLM